MAGTSNFWPAIAVPITVKMPEPMTAPMPSAVSDHGPSVFFNACSGSSESLISLSIDLRANSWLASLVLLIRQGAGAVRRGIPPVAMCYMVQDAFAAVYRMRSLLETPKSGTPTLARVFGEPALPPRAHCGARLECKQKGFRMRQYLAASEPLVIDRLEPSAWTRREPAS